MLFPPYHVHHAAENQIQLCGYVFDIPNCILYCWEYRIEHLFAWYAWYTVNHPVFSKLNLIIYCPASSSVSTTGPVQGWFA